MLAIDVLEGEKRLIMYLREEPGAHLDGFNTGGVPRFTLSGVYERPLDGPRNTVEGYEEGEIVVIGDASNSDGPVYIQWVSLECDDGIGDLFRKVQEGNPNGLKVLGTWPERYLEYRLLTTEWLRKGKRLGSCGRWFHSSVFSEVKPKIDAYEAQMDAEEVQGRAKSRAPTKAKAKLKAKSAGKATGKLKTKGAPAKKRTATRRKK